MTDNLVELIRLGSCLHEHIVNSLKVDYYTNFSPSMHSLAQYSANPIGGDN